MEDSKRYYQGSISSTSFHTCVLLQLTSGGLFLWFSLILLRLLCCELHEGKQNANNVIEDIVIAKGETHGNENTHSSGLYAIISYLFHVYSLQSSDAVGIEQITVIEHHMKIDMKQQIADHKLR